MEFFFFIQNLNGKSVLILGDAPQDSTIAKFHFDGVKILPWLIIRMSCRRSQFASFFLIFDRAQIRTQPSPSAAVHMTATALTRAKKQLSSDFRITIDPL